MPNIIDNDSEIGKTYATGIWDSENCDNSLATFPDGTDFSWGENSFWLDGCNDDNYVEVKIVNADNPVIILKSFKYTTNGRKELDLSQYPEISSTQDIKIRIEITIYV